MPRVVDEVVTSTVKPRAAAAVSRSLPFAIYIAFLAASPTLGPLLGDPRWLYAIQIGSVLGLLCFFARDYVELKCISSIRPADWARSLTIGILVFVAWIHLDHPALSVGNSGGFNPTLASGGVSPALALIRLCGAAIVVPVMEELFWRSFIMRWIDRTNFLQLSPASISIKALVVSTLLFGVEHHLWAAGIVAGLAYGWLYMRAGNLWVPITAHAVTNLLLGVWVLWTGRWEFW